MVIVTKSRLLLGAALLVITTLVGCGLTQTVSDHTVALTHALLYKQVKVIHLDFQSRGTLNQSADQIALATVVRVYQLKDRNRFYSASYSDLIKQDSIILKNNLLAQSDVTIMPYGSAMLNAPLDPDTKYIAIVGLFRAPDIKRGNWRLVLTPNELEPVRPRIIEVGNGMLALRPLNQDK